MSDVMAERAAAAQERAEFYQAAGIEPGERITMRHRLAFGTRAHRSEWAKHIDDSATPAGLARLVPSKAELRAGTVTRNGQERFHFEGIASVTDKPYEMYDWIGSYDEIVERSAFTDTLAADPDVAFLINHSGVTLARTKSSSLELGMVDSGFGMNAWCNPERSDVALLRHAVDDGEIDQMSFAFMIEEGWWSDDFMTFRISKLNLDRGDVSAVNYGANPYTSIAARTPGILADIRRLNTAAARKAIQVLSDREDIVKLDRLTEAFALLDREEDEARKAQAAAARGGMTGSEPLGRTIASLEAMLIIDTED